MREIHGQLLLCHSCGLNVVKLRNLAVQAVVVVSLVPGSCDLKANVLWKFASFALFFMV